MLLLKSHYNCSLSSVTRTYSSVLCHVTSMGSMSHPSKEYTKYPKASSNFLLENIIIVNIYWQCIQQDWTELQIFLKAFHWSWGAWLGQAELSQWGSRENLLRSPTPKAGLSGNRISWPAEQEKGFSSFSEKATLECPLKPAWVYTI